MAPVQLASRSSSLPRTPGDRLEALARGPAATGSLRMTKPSMGFDCPGRQIAGRLVPDPEEGQ